MAPVRVPPNMYKWYTYSVMQHGRITRHLSPFETRPVAPLLRTWHKKTFKKIKENWLHASIPVVIIFGTIAYADVKREEKAKMHWY